MAHREEPYDPYIPSGGAGGSAGPGNQRTAALQKEIDETIHHMQENINKVTERGESVQRLDQKTQELSHTSQGFRRGANRLRKQMWWKETKAKICFIILIAVLIAIVVAIAVPLSR